MENQDPVIASNSPKKGPFSRFVAFLKRHPLLFLLLLTPGIPEYLSASSSLTLFVINPAVFFLLLGANLGLYGSGVILIREAMIRWKKGYATVLALGTAYAIVEEGLALRTLYNPASPVAGTLGVYGHWMGVNWVWTAGLLIFHSVYSITLPIFLFGLAFPQLKKQSLVQNSGIIASIMALTIDSILLSLFVNYDPGIGILLLSGVAVATITFIAKRLPADLFKVKMGTPTRGPRTYGMLGIILFPATLFAGAIAASANAPPIIPIVIDFFFAYTILTRTYRSLRTENNQEHKTAFAIDLLIPVVIFGMVASLGLGNPLIFGADILFVLFSVRLWKKWHYWTMLERFSVPQAIPSLGPAP